MTIKSSASLSGLFCGFHKDRPNKGFTARLTYFIEKNDIQEERLSRIYFETASFSNHQIKSTALYLIITFKDSCFHLIK